MHARPSKIQRLVTQPAPSGDAAYAVALNVDIVTENKCIFRRRLSLTAFFV